MKPRPDLQTRIRAELAWDTRVDADEVDIDVRDGVVHLAGTVGSYAEKLAAQDAVQGLDDVHDVIADIAVRPTGELIRSDDDLEQMVSQLLVWDTLVPDDTVVATVNDGFVTLTGTVTVGAQRDEAERAIRHLAGVRGLDNQIEIAAGELAPKDVRSAILDALQRRARHSASHIDVTVDGHDVVLSGHVQSVLEKRAVLGAAGHAPGVDLICDELEIADDLHRGG